MDFDVSSAPKEKRRMIDDIDYKILEILQQNARTSNAEVARQVGMAPSAILERIRKLEERGVIEGYGVRVRPQAYGLELTAFVFVRADERPGEIATADRLAEIPEVQEVHHVAGEDCFLVKVRTEGTRALGALLRDRIGAIDTIRSTRSTIVLETIKDSWHLSPPAAPEGDDAA
jgi:Lrp/AsnC family transcriptional regulator, leucine-responsive regulatory protein